jgi:hypothetical protein
MDVISENKELLSRYPKTLDRLLKWEKANLLKFQEAVVSSMDQTQEIVVPEINQDTVADLLYSNWYFNPRRFYDFFDTVNVVVLLVYGGEGFYYSINGNNSEKYFYNRIEAETAAFLEALSLSEIAIAAEEASEPQTN